jgi:hypothetical protein
LNFEQVKWEAVRNFYRYGFRDDGRSLARIWKIVAANYAAGLPGGVRESRLRGIGI